MHQFEELDVFIKALICGAVALLVGVLLQWVAAWCRFCYDPDPNEMMAKWEAAMTRAMKANAVIQPTVRPSDVQPPKSGPAKQVQPGDVRIEVVQVRDLARGRVRPDRSDLRVKEGETFPLVPFRE